MKRRAILAALGSGYGVVAGCLAEDGNPTTDNPGGADGSDDVPDDSVAGNFDEVDRPECEVTAETVDVTVGDEVEAHETAATVPYPDPAETVDSDEFLAYVEDFDHAYVTHNVLCDRNGSGRILSISHTVKEAEPFDWYDDIHVIFLLRVAGTSAGVDAEGYMWVTDIAPTGVVYAIDETGIARAAFDKAGTYSPDEYEDNAPDPLESGTLVGTFF